MRPHSRRRDGYRWQDVERLAYKSEGGHFRDVTRQVLFDHGPSQLRYFEVAPGGHTTLERHEHVHQVMVLRGRGRALVGDEIFELQRHDLVCVASLTWHQFRAGDEEPLGFLCLVDRERDRPQRPSEADLAALRASPAVADFIRVPD